MPIFTGGRLKADELTARANLVGEPGTSPADTGAVGARRGVDPARARQRPRRLGVHGRHRAAGAARLRNRRAPLSRGAVDAARALGRPAAAAAGAEPARGRGARRAAGARAARVAARPAAAGAASSPGAARRRRSQAPATTPAAAATPAAATRQDRNDNDDRNVSITERQRTSGHRDGCHRRTGNRRTSELDERSFTGSPVPSSPVCVSVGVSRTAASLSRSRCALPRRDRVARRVQEGSTAGGARGAGGRAGRRENVVTVTMQDISTGPLISGTLTAEKDATRAGRGQRIDSAGHGRGRAERAARRAARADRGPGARRRLQVGAVGGEIGGTGARRRRTRGGAHRDPGQGRRARRARARRGAQRRHRRAGAARRRAVAARGRGETARPT